MSIVIHKSKDHDIPKSIDSSQRPKRVRNVVDIHKFKPRDPRFEASPTTWYQKKNKNDWRVRRAISQQNQGNSTGNDDGAFYSKYSFLFQMLDQEIAILRKELKKTKDPERRTWIRKEISKKKAEIKNSTRGKNQIQLSKNLDQMTSDFSEKKFQFKKSVKRQITLVQKYNELKSSGEYEKYVDKKKKKMKQKQKKAAFNIIS